MCALYTQKLHAEHHTPLAHDSKIDTLATFLPDTAAKNASVSCIMSSSSWRIDDSDRARKESAELLCHPP